MGDMTVEEAARAILSRHGRVSADAVRELHNETGMGMCDCKDALTALRTSVLESENANLRELVRDFYPFAKGRASKPWLAVRYDRMRELGVEVYG